MSVRLGNDALALMKKWKKIFWIAPAILLVLAAAGLFYSRSMFSENSMRMNQGIPLKGTVTDEFGLPVAQARVFIYSAGVREGTNPFCPTCYADCRKEATSSADGGFIIENVDPSLVFRLLVAAPGYRPSFAGKIDPQKGEAKIIARKRDVADLDSKPHLLGRVLSPEGKPVAGAVVTPFGFGKKDGMYMGPAKEDSIAVSDDEGKFTLVVEDKWKTVGVDIVGRGLAKTRFSELSLGNEVLDLKLKEGTTVRGKLTRNALPVANVQVGLCQENRDSRTFLGENVVETNGKGEFFFTNIPSNDSYNLYGKRESLGEIGVTPVKFLVTKEEGSSVDLGNLEVVPGEKVKVQIQLGDGKPVPSKTVVLVSRPQAWDSLQLQPDASGEINFLALAGEEFSASALLPGYLPVFERRDSYQSAPSFRVEGKAPTYVLRYERPAEMEKVTGKIIDAAGKPVGNVKITYILNHQNATVVNGKLQEVSREIEEVFSDEAGNFSIKKEKNASAFLALTPGSYAAQSLDSFKGVIQMTPWAEIHGKAFLGPAIAAGKKIDLVSQSVRNPGETIAVYISDSEIDASGNYLLEHVPEGVSFFGIKSGGYSLFAAGWFQQTAIDVKAGEKIEVQMGGKGAAIVGKVELPGEFKNFGETMKVSASLRPKDPVVSDATPWDKMTKEERKTVLLKARSYGFSLKEDGSFQIDDVLPGSYLLEITFTTRAKPDYLPGVALATAFANVVVNESSPFVIDPLVLNVLETGLKVGDIVPDFDIKTIQGEIVSADKLKGKVTLLRFHVWNEQGKDDQRFADALAALGSPGNLLVISLGSDSDAATFAKRYTNSRWPWLECYWPEDAVSLHKAFPTRNWPSYVVLGSQGQVEVSTNNFDEAKIVLGKLIR